MVLTQVATMQAIVQENFGLADQLALKNVKIPQPHSEKVQIRIHYAGVNPVDWKIREGHLQGALPHQFPLIPGWDAAGIISEVGANVSNFRIGDEVFAYCRKPTVRWGTYAEYVCVDATAIAYKPSNITFAQAAAFPLAGLTAWQALFDLANLSHKQTVLIHAGAGGVGSLAIQLAKNSGAFVITTASPANHSYLKELGADEIIDYHQPHLAETIRQIVPQGLDVILDTIGGDVYKEGFTLLKKQGQIVSLIEQPNEELAHQYQVKPHYLFVTPNGEQLQKISDLIQSDKVKPIPVQEMPLCDAAKAQEQVKQGHTQGKIVLKI